MWVKPSRAGSAPRCSPIPPAMLGLSAAHTLLAQNRIHCFVLQTCFFLRFSVLVKEPSIHPCMQCPTLMLLLPVPPPLPTQPGSLQAQSLVPLRPPPQVGTPLSLLLPAVALLPSIPSNHLIPFFTWSPEPSFKVARPFSAYNYSLAPLVLRTAQTPLQGFRLSCGPACTASPPCAWLRSPEAGRAPVHPRTVFQMSVAPWGAVVTCSTLLPSSGLPDNTH